MRIKVPVIGTVKETGPRQGHPGEMEVYGAEDDPIRVSVNLGNVSWTLVDLDIENGLAEIEVTPADEISEGETTRPTTKIEKQVILDKAKAIADADIIKGIKRLIRKDIQGDAISL